ncbi:hypothetical protein CIPAW_06G151700 [Carya illinoinensis]|uniref:Uncharacterized protein n=1 Tax=Carya illinoinensis TaxID=32201 RepID=A0A8T1QC79_CARIL|nr:hypothetical protein CIPAW_06G151700 [Carya illinoinensis]
MLYSLLPKPCDNSPSLQVGKIFTKLMIHLPGSFLCSLPLPTDQDFHHRRKGCYGRNPLAEFRLQLGNIKYVVDLRRGR